jgi:hypothetical protein
MRANLFFDIGVRTRLRGLEEQLAAIDVSGDAGSGGRRGNGRDPVAAPMGSPFPAPPRHAGDVSGLAQQSDEPNLRIRELNERRIALKSNALPR